ncbi:MAG TPA: acyl carrier protein [Pyrinomonadaceae bacterium]|nr:acyl carrier protein [Pyrinomonadaceae bacterium]
MPENAGANLSRAEIESRVKLVVVDELGLNEADFEMHANFVEDYAADSLDGVELGMALEAEFGIEFDDYEAELIRTPRDACDLIEGRLRRKLEI